MGKNRYRFRERTAMANKLIVLLREDLNEHDKILEEEKAGSASSTKMINAKSTVIESSRAVGPYQATTHR